MQKWAEGGAELWNSYDSLSQHFRELCSWKSLQNCLRFAVTVRPLHSTHCLSATLGEVAPGMKQLSAKAAFEEDDSTLSSWDGGTLWREVWEACHHTHHSSCPSPPILPVLLQSTSTSQRAWLVQLQLCYVIFPKCSFHWTTSCCGKLRTMSYRLNFFRMGISQTFILKDRKKALHVTYGLCCIFFKKQISF